MRLTKWFVIFALLGLVIGLAFVFISDKEKQPVWDQKRVIRYGFEIKNTTPNAQEDIAFKAYAPVALTSTQKVKEIQSTVPFEIIKDEFNNQILLFEIKHIPPYGILNLGVTVELMLSSVVAQEYVDQPIYLNEQPMIETGVQSIIELSEYISQSDSNKPKYIYDWLIDNIEYTGYGYADKGANYAVENLQGDCTEFAYLGTALGRLLNIPSRAVNGYIVSSDSKLKIFDYHTWTEMWFDGGWQVVDAQAQNYLTDQSDYLAMSVYSVEKGQNKEFEQFWISNTDIQVRMN